MKNLSQYFAAYSLLPSCLLAALLLLAACAGELAPPPTLVPTRSPVPKIGLTQTPFGAAPVVSLAVPTLSAVPNGTAALPTNAPTPSQGTDSISQGITSEGYYFLGREDAPNTIIMYSDAF